MIMKRILFFGSLLTLGTLAHAQTDVIQGVMRGKDFGVTYMLPQSVLNIEATVTKTQYIPGEFAKYANRYLRLDNVSSTPSEYYELTKVDVVPIGIPNSEQTYFIKMKDKTVAPLVELTQEGIIKTINMPRSAVSCPGVLRNVIFSPLKLIEEAPICCVIPPASPVVTGVERIASRRDVLPWST